MRNPTAERINPKNNPTRSPYPLRSASHAEAAAESSQMNNR